MCGPHELTPGWPPWYPVRRAHGRLTPCAGGIRATYTTTRVTSVRCTSSCGSAPPPPPALVAHRPSPLSLSARMPCQSAPLPPSPPTHPSAAPRMQLVRLRARPRVLDYCLPLAPAASARARDTRAALTTTATTTTTFPTTTHTPTPTPLPWASSLSEIPKKASAAGWICIM